MLQVKCFTFNPISENTYVVWDSESRECAIIDAGNSSPAENEELQGFIQQENLQVKHLLATHLHFDHAFGIRFVAQTFDVPLSAHRGDEFLLEHFSRQAELFGIQAGSAPSPIGKYIEEGDNIAIGEYSLTALHVPGHSPGSIVYYCARAGVLFVGDVLFRNSIGRTDLWGGNFNTLIDGINKKILTLPDCTVIYSGHGAPTDVGYEKDHNPYI